MLRLNLAALLAGFLLDLLLGDPEWLYHPVRLIGNYISWLEKHLRKRGGNLRNSALWLTCSTVLLTMAFTALILWVARRLDGMLEDQRHYLLRVNGETGGKGEDAE